MNMNHSSTLKRHHFVPITNVGLVSTIFDTTQVNIMRTFEVFDMRRIWLVEKVFLVLIPFQSVYHPKTFITR